MSLIFGIVAILVGVLVSSAYGEVRGIKKQWSGKLLFQSVARGLFSGLIATFLIGAFTGLLFGLKGGIRVGWSYAEPVGLVSGLNIGLLAGLFTFRTPRVFRTPRMGKQKQTSAPLPPAGGRYRWNPKKSRLRPDHRKKPQLRSRTKSISRTPSSSELEEGSALLSPTYGLRVPPKGCSTEPRSGFLVGSCFDGIDRRVVT